MHLVVPGGGPAIDGGGWVTTKHPTDEYRTKPYLTNNIELGRLFREKFTSGLRRLVKSGKLKLQDEWAGLQDPAELETWLGTIMKSDWNVFIEGPPHGKSRPERVLKYLARYLTGGPISDGRIIQADDDSVTFWARSKTKTADRRNRKENPSRPFTLRGEEFVRRWAMHILPKGYTRTRQFGGYHGSKRKAYLANCREHLAAMLSVAETASLVSLETVKPRDLKPFVLCCARCDVPMQSVEQRRRPSWKIIFDRRIYEDQTLYSPMHHIVGSRAPPAVYGQVNNA